MVSLTLWGKGASLALVGHPFSDRVTINQSTNLITIDQPCTPPFPTGLVNTESDFIVRSVKTGLGR